MVGALGIERSRSGIATVLHASLVPASPTSAAIDDARLNLFLVGTMEPLSAIFAADMASSARHCEEQWAGIVALEKRREEWERALLARGTAARTPEDAQAMLAEMERILLEREERLIRLSTTLGDYLESRRRVYSILGWQGAADDLHGPLEAGVLVAARERILNRLSTLSAELEAVLPSLVSMKARMEALRLEIQRFEALEPDAPELPVRRRTLVVLSRQWEQDTQRIRSQLATRNNCARGTRIFTAMAGPEKSIRPWDTLGAIERIRIERLAIAPAP